MADNFGEFSTPSNNPAFNTAWATLVRPYRGGSSNNVYGLTTKAPNWGKFHTQIRKLRVDSSTTQNLVYAMKPLNYAVVAADAAVNQAVVALKDDPGVYSTNYKYPLPPSANGLVSGVADNAISGGDYVAYQLRDGTWVLDTVASGTFGALTLTTTIPNVTGGGVVAGSILFFFGIFSDKNPATGAAHEKYLPPVSLRENLLGDGSPGSVVSNHPGEPIVIYCPNITAITSLVTAAGSYVAA